MKKPFTRLTALALSLALLLTSCGGGASATSMHLRKTEGTVGVSDGEGKELTPKGNLGLYSGYQVGTQEKSYAWIDLDRVKLTKLDQDSEIEIAKEGKKLEINVKSGSLFFNVTEPLADDETLDIVTSTMIIGIRGTCGWVGEDTAALLEGTVSVTAGDQEVTINAGEMAVLMEEGTLEVKPLPAASIPAFVRREVEEDEKLATSIQETTGIDLTGRLEATYPDALKGHGEEKILFAEEIDFEADGSPELLVIHRNNTGLDRCGIYRKGTESSEYLYETTQNNKNSFGTNLIDYKISLVESEGRLYVLLYRHMLNKSESGGREDVEYQYWGSVAQSDGDYSYWGIVDRVEYSWYSDGIGEAHQYGSWGHDETGLTNANYTKSNAGEFEAVKQKYTEVRVLVSD